MRNVMRRSKREWVLGAMMVVLAIGIGLPAWSGSVQANVVNPGKVVAPGSVETDAVTITVVEDTAEHVVIDYTFGEFTEHPVDIGGVQHVQIGLGEEPRMKEVVGAPELPHVCRSIIIPNDTEMGARVLTSAYYEVDDIDVAPSKGFIPRTVDPDEVPYAFGESYETDAFYPGEVATLRAPYILRDFRGVVVKVHPFQYNPVARSLRVYTSATVEVFKTGAGQVNVLDRPFRAEELSLAFHKIYQSHFLNYGLKTRYTPLDETGDLLVIYYDSWLSNVQPLVDHKNAIGLTTTAVGVSTIGNDATSIKNYIQNAYDTGDLAFVLLVGDAAQVATPYASGGAADPTYALVAGGDSYPDIMIGRFSAQSTAEVDTQVLRTIEYETMPATQQAWFKRGTGIASNQGPGHNGEYDNQHMDYIRDDLLAYGYTSVDQIYDPTATDTQVTNALNAGRGIVNYCGHGSATSWGTTGFNNADVNNLANDNMLPFIFSVACNNGEFNNYIDCFAEAWLQATNGSEPTGAIAMYASSISQSWSPPMDAQDEFVDLLVAEQYVSFGTLCFAGSCKMIDINGAGGISMFNTWHVFGDPSVRVVGGGGPTCNDGIQNQGEDRIDCGGPCPPCECLADGECDDTLFCTGTETCDAYGYCQPGADPCPGQYCDEANDVCVECLEDAHCDDGLFCNGAETCVSGTCQPGTDPCPGQACDEVNDVCLPCDNDGTCEPGEDCHNCPNDCFEGPGAVCGNGVCETADGEDCQTCPDDCNGLLTGKPSGRYCCGDGSGDYGVTCADSRCTGGGNTCTTEPAASSCCGDGVCEGTENMSNCAVDCACTSPADCDDGEECTIDDCVEGACQYTPVPDDAPCSEGICCDGTCDPLVCSVDADCDDGDTCTTDTCYNGDTCAAYCDYAWPACGLADGCCGPTCTAANDPDCECLLKGEPCTLDSECCSNWCHRGYCK